MSLISLTCSQTLVLYSSDPPHTALTNPLNSSLPSTSIPASTLKLSPHSRTLLRNGNPVISRRNRFQFHANSGDSDADTNESTSTSLLSFLCHLLKLFSVSSYFSLIFLRIWQIAFQNLWEPFLLKPSLAYNIATFGYIDHKNNLSSLWLMLYLKNLR